MKVRLEIDEQAKEPEIIVRCREDSGEMIRTAILEVIGQQNKLPFLQDGREYYVPVEDLLFLESVDGRTYAHTVGAIYETRMRLYELENILPGSFVRVSKSTIANTRQILSITRNLTGPSLIEFLSSHKRTNASRGYFKQLRNKLNERK